MPPDRTEQLQIVLVTDVFPPGSGGSGWSTFYLAKALSEAGHSVKVLRYSARTASYSSALPALRRTELRGIPVEDLVLPPAPTWTRRLPIERAWLERQAARQLERRATRLALRGEANILHAQHKVSALSVSSATSRARARGANVASIATVRDYWPLCPSSTRMAGSTGTRFECRNCHQLLSYLRCVRSELTNSKLNVPLALARFAGTQQAARALARCDAVIAVSRYMRDELAMSGRVPGDRLYAIPNLVDLPSVDRASAGPWPLDDISPESDFALFVGKWDVNKGVSMLPEAVKRSGISMPVVLLGEGLLKVQVEADALAAGLDFRFHSWLDNVAVLRVMSSARLLIFPSAWQEPLSRVLLEGCAVGAAIVALDTGGTADVIVHGVSGWLAPDLTSFAEGISRLAADDALNHTLRAGARARAARLFAAPRVAAEVELLYRTLLDRQGHCSR